MRALLLILVAALALAGCAAPSADTVGPSAEPDGADVADAAANATATDLGSMGFMLGPQGSTAVTATSATLDGIVLAENLTVTVTLTLVQGATVNFVVSGIDGCEITVPSVTAGSDQTFTKECVPPAGEYTLTMAHTTGAMEGHVAVTGAAA